MIDEMMPWARDLWPINRSLTGEGVRATLSYIEQQVPNLRTHSVPTGYKAFDWDVPMEWNVRQAYIATIDGRRIVDFHNNNLHLLGYSVPVDMEISRTDLDEHLYSLPEMPQAIPYATSYYRERWGFCVTQEQRDMMTDERYRVFIDTSLGPVDIVPQPEA